MTTKEQDMPHPRKYDGARKARALPRADKSYPTQADARELSITPKLLSGEKEQKLLLI